MPRSSARERLLDSAETLFAAHGVAGVSLRTINARAGLSAAALHYHFGSQRALLEALLERRMPGLMERRSELLDTLERAPGPPGVRDVLATVILPLCELIAEAGDPGLRYVRMIHRLEHDGSIDPDFVVSRWPSGVERLMPLLERALPELPTDVIRLRFELANRAMLAGIARAPEGAGADLDAQLAAILDFVTGALEAPVGAQPR